MCRSISATHWKYAKHKNQIFNITFLTRLKKTTIEMYHLLNEMCEDTPLSAYVFEWHKIFSEEKRWKVMNLLPSNSEN
jgi:hypothetical protein